MRQIPRLVVVAGLIQLLGPAVAPPAHAQGHGDHGQAGAGTAPASRRVTMEALHAAGGVPPGWRFTVPPGDAVAGRQAFVDWKCYACHAIKGEQFPLKPGETATAGPELSGMGGHHPAEYLAESIVNPSAVLIEGPGYIGGDGRSIMPSYPDMTLGQLVNLVAYLKTLGTPEPAHAHEPAPERMVGGYRVRLAYKTADAGGHMHHAQGGMMMSKAPARLLVFLMDQAGQPIPHTPVQARIAVPGKPAKMVKLGPTFGAQGFHYDADVTLPEGTNRITLSIGPTAMRLGPDAPSGLKRAQTATFPWK